MTSAPNTTRATLIGALAVPMWGTLALLTKLAGDIPPLQIEAMAFGTAFLLTCVVWGAKRRNPLPAFRQGLPVWALGIAGLFGYHYLYILAFQSEPAAEVNLINYLWPLLIVLFSALLPGQRLTLPHVAGAALGFAGTWVLIGAGANVSAAYLPGFMAAFGAAITWAAYSVLSRRYGDVPTDVVGGFCLATAVLSGICHLLFETTVVPDATGWLAILAMGMLPVGAAFFVWDHGCKRGDIRTLGAIAYATPLLSTLLLGLAGLAETGPRVWAACALIVGGAVLASGNLLRRRGAAAA